MTTPNPNSIGIQINPSTIFLSDDEEFHAGLPEKCIFDKGKTGCGGTTLALNGPHNYVVTVPYVSLIKNKLPKHKDVLGVFGDIMDNEIADYCKEREVKKFLVTYDSIERLLKFIDPAEFKLLVDEYHTLFTHYGTVDNPFRKEAVQKVLKCYEFFSDYCFMSATPLEPEFILEELKGLHQVTALWPKQKEIEVMSIHCESVLDSTSLIIQKYLKGEEKGNAYFFLNSLRAINKLIKDNRLTVANTRLVYSESNEKEHLIPRGNLNSKPILLNFLTSAAFEGSDIFDENGRTYIVSDYNYRNSLVDISTSFMQICGRIRNSKYADSVVHLHGKTRYDLRRAFDDYKAACDKDIEEAQKDVKLLNDVSESTRNTLDLKRNSGYLTKIYDGTFVYDPNLVKVDLYNFRLTRILYDSSAKLNEAYSQHGFRVTHVMSNDQGVGLESQPERKMSFKEKVLFIKESGIYGQKGYEKGYHYINPDINIKKQVERIIRENPELEEAIRCPKIGFDGIEYFGYNRRRVHLELIKHRKTSQGKKVSDILENIGYKAWAFKTNEEISRDLELAFKECGIAAKPVATNIENYFEATQIQKRVTVDGVATRKHGWRIIRKKGNL